MVSIKVKEGESGERALRRFKKKWEKAGILREFKSSSCVLSIAFFAPAVLAE